MKHELKIWPQYYCRVADGTKTFEVRHNDRAFQSGDTVVLMEWDPTPANAAEGRAPKGFTQSAPLEFKIGYIHPHSSGEIVFSLLPIPPKQIAYDGFIQAAVDDAGLKPTPKKKSKSK